MNRKRPIQNRRRQPQQHDKVYICLTEPKLNDASDAALDHKHEDGDDDPWHNWQR